jgi:predicted O-linked N-acetylglucosamine transferase (SPINDLY family)
VPKASLSEEALAEQIRADAIDLLIDLSGHTGNNRLLTFARRPAPVQLTWMGYVGTTGLAAIDYLLADRFHVPVAAEKHLAETVLRLPDGYLCYEPPSYAPPVGPLPAEVPGRVTFGAFHSTAKITAQVIATWAEIMRQLPQARLVVKSHWLDDAGVRHHLATSFAAHDIAAERLELLGNTGHRQHLEQYNLVDLGLDSVPYSGGLTTCEACWMGVPVVTCPGETFASRHSLSHLSNIGMTETITSDLADYVSTAVRLARDLPRLAGLRAGLRERMAQAPLCDADRFTGQLATTLRQAWRESAVSPPRR